ncbi:hypothetical protein M0R72_11610 [Candidatus Pacearchaeota archaeon]|jgi:hypothetical protein|nr:hypothetical protein [Candidatus Pacearchaeota archaeon]
MSVDSASTKTFPIILPECRGCIGILEAVGRENGAAVANIGGRSYEVPDTLHAELQDLVGERVIIACIAGQIRAGRRST